MKDTTKLPVGSVRAYPPSPDVVAVTLWCVATSVAVTVIAANPAPETESVTTPVICGIAASATSRSLRAGGTVTCWAVASSWPPP